MANDKILRDYVMKNDKKEEIFHTSGIAASRSGAGMGAASSESFSARRAMDQNRSLVEGYQASKIMRGNIYQGARAKTYNPSGSGLGSGALGESAKNLTRQESRAQAANTTLAGNTPANTPVGQNRGGAPQTGGSHPMRQAPPRRGF